jgi:hypothetical protein
MVRRDFAPRNEFIPYRAREREINHGAAVKVADFPFAGAKFAPAEAMLSNGYVRPTQQLAFDGFADFSAWFPIEVSPLRERLEDMRLLADHFIKQSARRLGMPRPRLSKLHLQRLQSCAPCCTNTKSNGTRNKLGIESSPSSDLPQPRCG